MSGCHLLCRHLFISENRNEGRGSIKMFLVPHLRRCKIHILAEDVCNKVLRLHCPWLLDCKDAPDRAEDQQTGHGPPQQTRTEALSRSLTAFILPVTPLLLPHRFGIGLRGRGKFIPVTCPPFSE
ncbi:hypothetical protein ACFSQ7_11800 [Paenibacillus rhizoplanae]